MMFHLAWPWMALLLPLPWIMLRLRRTAGPSGSALYLPFAASVETVAPPATRPRCAPALLTAVWALLVLAAMRPQWLGQPLPVPTPGREIMLAIDCSGSMATQDMGGREPAGDCAEGCRTLHRPAPRRSDRPDSFRHATLSAGAAHGRHRDRASVSGRGRGRRRGPADGDRRCDRTRDQGAAPA